MQRWVSSSSSSLTQAYSYNAAGTVATTSYNGTVTTYNYNSSICNGAFPTSVSVAGLTTNYAYNCTGGVVTSVTDPNNAIASTSYTDGFFWRPASTTDPLGNVTNYYYYPALGIVGQTEFVMNFNSGSSTSDVVSTPTTWGDRSLASESRLPARRHMTQWRRITISGRIAKVSLPFATGLGQVNANAAGTSTPMMALVVLWC